MEAALQMEALMQQVKAIVERDALEQEKKRNQKILKAEKQREYRRLKKTTTQQTCVDFFDDPWTYNEDCKEEKIETIEWNEKSWRRFNGTLQRGRIVIGQDKSGDFLSPANYENFSHMKSVVEKTLKLPENQNCYFKGGAWYIAEYNKEKHVWHLVTQKQFCNRFRKLVWEIWCEYLEYNYKNVFPLTRHSPMQSCFWTNKNIQTFFEQRLSNLTEPTRKLKGFYIKALSS